MFCKNCGKPISDDLTYCEDCQNQISEATVQDSAIEEVVTIEATSSYDYVTDEKPMMRGFKPGLISTILGVIGSSIATYISFNCLGALSTNSEDTYIAAIIVGVLFGAAGLVMGILSLTNGINAIKTFKATPYGLKKPIPAIILGIVGVVYGATTLFCTACNAISVLSLLMLL